MPITTKKYKSPLLRILKNNPAAAAILKVGELVDGSYLGRDNYAAYFDLGRQGVGIIYGTELANAQNDLKILQRGAKTLVKVIDQENDAGYVELSLRETHKQKAWEKIKDLKESEETINVKISSANTGGLLSEVEKLAAFLPVSQLSSENYPQVADGNKEKILEELKKMIGRELQVKVIDSDPRSNKLIISEKAIASKDIKERLSKYKTGDIVDGIITGVADFGAFMKFADDPEIEGLIHISELDHRLIENPKEVVAIDDTIKAQITEIKDSKVSLSIKALKANPWDKVEEKYKVGQEIEGKVSRFNPFGAFISLDKDIQGLIHVSEFGGVEEMKSQLEIGTKYNFIVAIVKPEEKRIVLKLNR